MPEELNPYAHPQRIQNLDFFAQFSFKAMVQFRIDKCIIKEINTCLKNGCYIAELTTLLILPDICGKVESPNDSNSSRYKKWYREWIGQYESVMMMKLICLMQLQN